MHTVKKEKMSEYVMVRLTPSEKRRAKQQARKARLGLAEWFRASRLSELNPTQVEESK